MIWGSRETVRRVRAWVQEQCGGQHWDTETETLQPGLFLFWQLCLPNDQKSNPTTALGSLWDDLSSNAALLHNGRAYWHHTFLQGVSLLIQLSRPIVRAAHRFDGWRLFPLKSPFSCHPRSLLVRNACKDPTWAEMKASVCSPQQIDWGKGYLLWTEVWSNKVRQELCPHRFSRSQTGGQWDQLLLSSQWAMKNREPDLRDLLRLRWRAERRIKWRREEIKVSQGGMWNDQSYVRAGAQGMWHDTQWDSNETCHTVMADRDRERNHQSDCLRLKRKDCTLNV